MPDSPQPQPQVMTPQGAPMPIDGFAQEAQLDLNRGTQFLLRFPATHGPTIYLFDKTDNLYVPFQNNQAFFAATGMDPATALAEGYIHDLTKPPLPGIFIPDKFGFGQNGEISSQGQTYIQSQMRTSGSPSLGDADALGGQGRGGPSDGKGDGNTSGSSSSNPGGYGYYGNPQNTDQENLMMSELVGSQTTDPTTGQPISTPGILQLWLNSGAISQSAYQNAITPTNLANLVHATAYGGYSLSDVFAQIQSQSLGLNQSPISQTIPASQYYNTQAYATAKSDPQLTMPQNISSNSALMGSPLAQMPSQAFQQLVAPVGNPTSPSMVSQAENMQNEAADLALQSINANTAQEKAVADQNYQDWQQYIGNIYGFALANDAIGAWGQLSQMSQQAEQGYTADSGALHAADDMVLNQRRTYDSQLRQSQSTQEEMQQRNYYLSSASPAQINALSANQKSAWGLLPSNDLLTYLNQTLPSEYPNMPPDQLAAIKAMYVDSNGNLTSQLYSNLSKNQYSNMWGQIPTTPSSGKEQANMTNIENQNITAATQAEEPYDTSDPAHGFLYGNNATSNPSPLPGSNSFSSTSSTGITPQSLTPPPCT